MKDEIRFNTFIQENGYPLIGTNDRGLTKEGALTAISLAQSEGLTILGGDVYLQRHGKIVPDYANWFTEKKDGENAIDYSLRTCMESETYIKNYREPEDADLLFVFVVSS